MSDCPEAAGIDFEAYLVDPRAESFAAFRGHFPTCERCSTLLAELSRLEQAIQAASAAAAPAHPEAETLLAYQSEAASLLEDPARRSVELHLERCGPCRDQLRALATFDFASIAATAPAAVTPRAPGLGDRFAGWLRELAAPIPIAATAGLAAAALAVLVAVQIGLGIGPLGSDAGEGSPDAQRPLVETPTRGADAGHLAEAGGSARAPLPVRDAVVDEAGPEADAVPEPSLAQVEAPLQPSLARVEAPLQPSLARVEAPLQPSPVRESDPTPDAAPRSSETRVVASRQDAAPALAPEPISPIDALWAEAGGEAPSNVRLAHAQLGPPLYTPPANEVGPGRVHDVLRSGDPSIPDLWALAPDHAGRTLRASPTLYWSASSATPGPLTFTLVDPAASQPVLEIEVDPVDGAGIRSIALADSDVELVSGTVYQWFIALPEPDDDGFVVVSGGSILRTAASEDALSALAEVPPAHLAHQLAASGYFYDAVDLFSQWDAHEARAALLSQTGLDLPLAPGI